MNINESEADSHQAMDFKEPKGLFLAGDDGLGQGLEETENCISVWEIPTGQFTDDKGMAENFFFFEQRDQ